MKKILFYTSWKDVGHWHAQLQQAFKDFDIEIWKDQEKKYPDVEVAIIWRMPKGRFINTPNLRLIIVPGSAVDHLLDDPTLPEQVKIVRAIDSETPGNISRYVLAHVLKYFTNSSVYQEQQKSKVWLFHRTRKIKDFKIGLLGYGHIGKSVYSHLINAEFPVICWKKNRTNSESHIYTGQDGFDQVISCAKVIVCLLPLTRETHSLINEAVLEKMARGSYFINCGRGEIVEESALIKALDSRMIEAATLDVFPIEPLPEASPLWSHRQVDITPHAAGRPSPETTVPVIRKMFLEFYSKESSLETVSRTEGY